MTAKTMFWGGVAGTLGLVTTAAAFGHPISNAEPIDDMPTTIAMPATVSTSLSMSAMFSPAQFFADAITGNDVSASAAIDTRNHRTIDGRRLSRR